MNAAMIEELFQGRKFRLNDHEGILPRLYGSAWKAYRELWDGGHRFEENSFPVHMDFELNHACNLRCHFCYWSNKEFAATASSQVFPLEAFENVLGEAVPKGLRAVNLENNNEPLLNKRFPEYVAAARRLGVLDVMFHTNGHLLTPEMSARLIEAGLTRIFISVDAFSADTYRAMRGGGENGYAKVIENIHSLLEARSRMKADLPLVTLCFLRSSVNEHEMEAFKAFWEPQVETVHVQMYQDFVAPDLRTGPVAPLATRCAQPMVRMAVRVDGTVQPCCSFFGYERYVVGNVLTQSVQEIWDGEEYRKLRRLMREGRLAENSICLECAKTWDTGDRTDAGTADGETS